MDSLFLFGEQICAWHKAIFPCNRVNFGCETIGRLMYHPFDLRLNKFGGDLVVECLFGGLDNETS